MTNAPAGRIGRLPWSNAATDNRFWDFLDPADGAVERAWEPVRGRRWADRVFLLATNAGEHGLVWSLCAVVFAARRWLRGDRSGAVAMLKRFWLSLIVESVVVNGVLKGITRRGRPDDGDDRADGVRMPITSSMPSGHATSSMMSATILAGEASGPVERTALYAAAATVAWSRVHVRIHHPTDVMAGVLLGLGVGRWIRRRYPIAPPRR